MRETRRRKSRDCVVFISRTGRRTRVRVVRVTALTRVVTRFTSRVTLGGAGAERRRHSPPDSPMEQTPGMKLLVHSARQVVTVTDDPGVHRIVGADMANVATRHGPLSIVVNNDGKIEFVGSDDEAKVKFSGVSFARVVDASDHCVLPGFIDAHTHPIWAGDRVNEFAMKLAGATYLDIHKSGGGIFFTVDKTREASDAQLEQLLLERLRKMGGCGTTTVECKSGYGLESDDEMRLLRIIEAAKSRAGVEISSTYCGAHAVPRGKTAQEATEDIINKQLPRLKRLMADGHLSVENVDVFCEKGVYDTDQSRRILQAGQQIGLAVNFHGDELYPTKSAEMGGEIKATAISHLEEISEQGIEAMAAAGSVAVLLPTTAFVMRLKSPPARSLIQKGVAVALGSDFNPNAHCYSMPMVMHLACVIMGMSMSEAMIAATLNAAASLNRGHTHGSITVGKFADLVLVKAPRWEHIIYQIAGHDELITMVVKKGNVIFEK